MICLLYDTTIDGVRHGKGSILGLDPAIEAGLIAEGDADRNIDFASAARLPVLVSQSYAAITRSSDSATDTAFAILASVTIPGGTMNLNGELIVTQDWKYTSSATVKTFAMDWNGVNVSGPTATTTVRSHYRMAIKNLNSLSSQSIFGNTTFGTAAGDPVASANTANNVIIDHRCKWSANVISESIILLGYSIWYYPGTI